MNASYTIFSMCTCDVTGMVLTTQTAVDAKVLDLAALVKHIFHEEGERIMVKYQLPIYEKMYICALTCSDAFVS